MIQLLKIYTIVSLIFCAVLLDAQCYEERHNTGKENTWISCEASMSPNQERGISHWIMIELDSTYPIASMHIWNQNHPDELNNGIKNMIIDLSIDGTEWFEKSRFELEQGPASAFYEGVSGPILEGFPAKFILITAIDNYGGDCFSLAELTVTSSPDNPMFADVEIIEEIDCNGNNNAIIKVNAVGGTPPYSYQIDDQLPQLSPEFTGLAAGFYTFIITDATQSYQLEKTIEIKEPDAILSSSIVNDTSLYISALGGTGQLSFSLDGIDFQASNELSVFQNGYGTYTVRDENGCEEEFSFFAFIDLDDDGYNSDEDCNDEDALINPSAEEIANNDIDEDCDGNLLIIDEDGDGYNSDEDCDDNDADINPGADEIANNDIDEDCNGVLLIIDEDGDGYHSDEDCDDYNAYINPGAEEIPNNGIDENCDGIDDIIDNDGDGFGTDVDCDDTNADINPDAEEIPNNDIDENCDGIILIIDEDGDGFNSDEDCDDTNADINPDAEEIPGNDVDENCDGILGTTNTEEQEFSGFRIFPNPFTAFVNIELAEPNNKQLKVSDLQGKLIASLPLKSDKNRVELSGLLNGVYFFQIIDIVNNKSISTEMIKVDH